MVTSTYMTGRVKYARPQAMLWSEGPGMLSGGVWIPTAADGTGAVEGEDFIILTDHNRGEISVTQQRIENRQRMINGRMRSYFTADKIVVSTAWRRIPSRSYSTAPSFDANGVYDGVGEEYTVDGGAGGAQMLEWYNNHQGPFWVFLSYDKNGDDLVTYNDRRLMYFTAFDHSIEKRGATNHDMWNISLTLEEA